MTVMGEVTSQSHQTAALQVMPLGKVRCISYGTHTTVGTIYLHDHYAKLQINAFLRCLQ